MIVHRYRPLSSSLTLLRHELNNVNKTTTTTTTTTTTNNKVKIKTTMRVAMVRNRLQGVSNFTAASLMHTFNLSFFL